MSQRGLLAIWHDVQPDFVPEYLAWHSKEHLPERIALPGFLKACRYRIKEGDGQEFLALVETSGLDAFDSPEYHYRLNHPTAWTTQLMPRYSRVNRVLCTQSYDHGQGTGATVACLRFNARNGSQPLLQQIEPILNDSVEQQCVWRIRLGTTDSQRSARESEESRLRGQDKTGGQDQLLLIEGEDCPQFRMATDAVRAGIAAYVDNLTLSYYAFSYSLDK